MASRSLPAGVGFKPPSAAAFKRRGGERLRKRRFIRMSGEYREDERKRTADDASKVPEEAVKTGVVPLLQDKSEGNLFTVQTAAGVKAA